MSWDISAQCADRFELHGLASMKICRCLFNVCVLCVGLNFCLCVYGGQFYDGTLLQNPFKWHEVRGYGYDRASAASDTQSSGPSASSHGSAPDSFLGRIRGVDKILLVRSDRTVPRPAPHLDIV